MARKPLDKKMLSEFMRDPNAAIQKDTTEQPSVKLSGNQHHATTTDTDSTTDSTTDTNTDLASKVLAKFQTEEKEPTVRLTVDLARSQHKKFKSVAQHLNTDMSSLARVLVEEFLSQVEKGNKLAD